MHCKCSLGLFLENTFKNKKVPMYSHAKLFTEHMHISEEANGSLALNKEIYQMACS